MKISIGEKFTRLTVISISERKRYFVCQCNCGKIKEIRQDHLLSNKTLSCGCLKDEAASKRAHVMHIARTKHGLCDTSIYKIWHSMRQRCSNEKSKSYPRYGGRGITVCDNWINSFENFLSDMGHPEEGMTIERKDNNLGYSKENCKWATRLEQQNNRNVCQYITYNNETHTVSEWSVITGIHKNTLSERFHKNWPLEDIFSKDKKTYLPGLAIGAKISQAARLARTHCRRGHEYTSETMVQTKRQRVCLVCKDIAARERAKLLNQST